MDIYYRREVTWCKWPWQDVKATDEVLFSTQKKRFDENVFLRLDPSVEQNERIKKVAEALSINIKKIKLTKLN